MLVFDTASETDETRYDRRPTIRIVDWGGQITQPDAKAGRDAIILVHGFNSSDKILKPIYAQIARDMLQVLPSAQFGIYGFHWPSDGSALGYGFDLHDAYKAAPLLLDAIDALRLSSRYKRVHLVTHSMGGQIAMEALGLAVPGEIDTITLQGADVDASSLAIDGQYGGYYNRIDHVWNLWSADDAVVNVLARLWPGRWFARAGADGGLRGALPSNYVNFNARLVYGGPVDHSTYATSVVLHQYVARRILNSTQTS